MKTCGIYVIRNTVNGKTLVGSASNVEKRFAEHRYRLRKGNHWNCHLQRAWNLQAGDGFSFELVEECPEDQLLDREDFWMFKLGALHRDRGYNMRTANNVVHDDSTIAKMRACKLGTRWTEDRKRTHALAQSGPGNGFYGKKHSEEARAKMKKARKLQVFSEETREKLRKRMLGPRNHMFGVKMSSGSREKMRRAKLGRKQSPEVIEKRMQKVRGVPLSEAHKQKLRKKVFTPEYRAALRAAWVRRKAQIPSPSSILPGSATVSS